MITRTHLLIPALGLILTLTQTAGIAGVKESGMRIWNSSGIDDGSIHSMGNGEMVVYGQGPNIAFMYGPPYSSPGILSLHTKGDVQLKDEAVREDGTAIWKHKTLVDNSMALEFTEFVAAGIPAYFRTVDCSKEGVRWVVKPNAAGEFVLVKLHSGVWIQSIKPGQKIFNYPSNFWSYHWIVVQGSCKAELNDKGELVVSCLPGKGTFAIVGSDDYPAGVSCLERVLSEGEDTFLRRTREQWSKFTQNRLKNRPLPSGTDPELARILDGAAVLIKSQQSSDGGEMAGPYFPLAYVRDQYGVARGMLALGMYEEAKQNLLFRFAKFQRFGSLLTAEAMGTDCARHRHENDEVEGPAYTILQTRDYVQATGDVKLARKMWPMLEWCSQVQRKHLADGLMPFNGDETYVAGHFYPRSGLLQGSADTTLAFIESSNWIAHFAVEQKLWDKHQADELLKLASMAHDAYRKAFFANDRIWANEPEREKSAELPRFRHGVCEGGCGWFGWTQRSTSGRYACPKCLSTKDLPAEHPKRMEVNSVGLLPAYLGSDILSKAEQKAVIEHVISQALSSGHIPSVPGNPGCVGYDPGLILLNLASIKHPAAKQAFDRTLKLLDQAGAWNEYYDAEDKPRNGCCRARPWETGVNADAITGYLESR